MTKRYKYKKLFDYIGISDDIKGVGMLDFTLRMQGRESLYIGGCKCILKYSRSEIKIQMKKFILSVCGECMICSSYSENSIEIEGKINSISFI